MISGTTIIEILQVSAKALYLSVSATMIIWPVAVIVGKMTDDAENHIFPIAAGIFLLLFYYL